MTTDTNAQATVPVAGNPLLAEKAAAIRKLLKRTIRDIVEIGRRFTECKEIVGYGNWLPWLEQEFGIASDRLVQIWMQVYEKSKSEKFSDLMQRDLPLAAFYLLAAPSAPESALDEVAERAAQGDRLTHAGVKEAIARGKRKQNGAAVPNAEPSNTENEDASAEARKAFYSDADKGGDQAAAEPATNVEWFTPAKYINLARRVLGEIDVDPASCALAQETVGAKQYFAKEDDGAADDKEWRGRVWLNPPYTQPHITDFVNKLIVEREAGHTKAAILWVHAFSSSKWFHRAADAADVMCFTRGRVPFDGADGAVADPATGQVFLFYGDDVQLFASVFSEIGLVVTSIRDEKLPGWLRAIPIETVIGVLGEQLRAALPANPLQKLKKMDDATAARTLLSAFGPGRLAKIGRLVTELRTATGKKSGTSKPGTRPFKRGVTFEQTVDEEGNKIFAQPREIPTKH